MTWLIITSLKRGRLTQDMGVWEGVCDVCVCACVHTTARQCPGQSKLSLNGGSELNDAFRPTSWSQTSSAEAHILVE